MLMLFCLMFLTSCSTTNNANLNQKLNQWVGMSQESLYYSWGEPNNVSYPAPDMTIATYNQVYDGPIGGVSEPYSENVVYSAISDDNYGLPPQNDTYYCNITFTIQDNQVTDYSYNGDDCVATSEND